ncbi:MAG: TonB-dependent receptor [Bacteroidota bacterium]
MKKIQLVLLFLCCSPLFILAQSGAIAGKVVEADSGFEAIGANVVISGTSTGASTDLDGAYIIKDLEPGTYDIECSYVGFETVKITGVIVKDGETTSLDIQLGASSIGLEEVIVKAKAFSNTEAAVLTLQKKAPVVLDGISSSQISKSGDSDVAGAVKRVTGVTVEGGKYVYVRGLGDRYSKTTLNRAEIPGLDPNRNTVQMDLFPTSLIDNILIYKTFSPDLPGDFSGGYVDIATKDFPTEKTVSASVSLGYHSYGSLNSDFLNSEGSSTDWLGFDNGFRIAPDAAVTASEAGNFPNYSEGLSNTARGQELADLTRSFSNNWGMTNESQFLDYGFSVSYGNQTKLGKLPLGFIGALTFSNSSKGYNDGVEGIYELTANVASTDKLTDQLNLVGDKGEKETIWGALLSSSLKLSDNNKIGLTLMHNQNAAKSTKFLQGTKSRDDAEDIFQTRTYRFTERGLSTFQLDGKHVITNANNIEIKWIGSYSISSQDVPDLRFFTNRFDPEDNRYRLKTSDNPPTRFYRDMSQDNLDGKLDITIPFKQWSKQNSKFKLGTSYVFRDREFRETRYNFNNQSASFATGNPFDYFAEENLLTVDVENGGYANGGAGAYVADNFDPKNNYDADQSVVAFYGMFELPVTKNFRVIAGVRGEQTKIKLTTFDEALIAENPILAGNDPLLDNFDILPSVNANYDLSEKMKIRGAFSRTLARPSFRELAPFASFDTDGGFIFVGNPDLERTLVDNYDLRFEFYPSSGEIISVSGFYKNFENPIERTFNPQAANTELTFRNVEQAQLAGAEVEFRKKLDFIKPLRNFSIGANFSYIYSTTDIDSLELALIVTQDPNTKASRQMFGQAPYVVNALASYRNEKGTSANLAFNMVGPRLTVITRGATPDYEQKPQPSLNFNISQKFGKGFTVKLAAKNLLNAKYREVATFKDVEYEIKSYNQGMSFSLGIKYDLK